MNLFNDLKKPINLVNLIIAALSIVLAIVFYFNSVKEKIPTYLISEPIKIFDSNISSPKIKVLNANSKIIENDIYVITITFWNSGDLPIEINDIRKPVKISLKPCNQILDYKILNATHQDIAFFNLHQDSIQDTNTYQKSLVLDWKHLDPNFGVKFQIIYASKKDTKIDITGYIVGVDEFLDGKPANDKNIVYWIGVGALILIIGLMDYIRKILLKITGRDQLNALIFMIIVITFGFFFYMGYLKGIDPPI